MKKNLFRITSLILTLVMVFTLAGCGGKKDDTSSSGSSTSTSTSTGTSSSDKADGPVKNKVAFFLPLTGEQMQYGESMKRGAELSLNQFNEKHGTDYIIEFLDDKGDPTEAVNVANKIVADETVFCGMGSYSSSCAMAAAPVFEENDLLLFSSNASHTDFPAMGKNMFSIVMSQKYEGEAFAKALYNKYGPQKVAILHQNTDHGVLAVDVFTKAYTALGGEVVCTENFVPGQTSDFSPVLSKIKGYEPDVLYINAAYNDCAQAMLQAQALKMDCIFLNPSMSLCEDFLNVAGDQIKNLLIMSSIPAYLDSVLEGGRLGPDVQNFVDTYRAAYNETPDGFAATAFDAITVVLSTAEEVGTETPAMREYIAALRGIEGVGGENMSFNDNKEMIKDIYMHTIENGEFVVVEK